MALCRLTNFLFSPDCSGNPAEDLRVGFVAELERKAGPKLRKNAAGCAPKFLSDDFGMQKNLSTLLKIEAHGY